MVPKKKNLNIPKEYRLYFHSHFFFFEIFVEIFLYKILQIKYNYSVEAAKELWLLLGK
jgi:hypothetical protein